MNANHVVILFVFQPTVSVIHDFQLSRQTYAYIAGAGKNPTPYRDNPHTPTLAVWEEGWGTTAGGLLKNRPHGNVWGHLRKQKKPKA